MENLLTLATKGGAVNQTVSDESTTVASDDNTGASKVISDESVTVAADENTGSSKIVDDKATKVEVVSHRKRKREQVSISITCKKRKVGG